MERMTEVRTKEEFFKLGTFLWLVDEHTQRGNRFSFKLVHQLWLTSSKWSWDSRGRKELPKNFNVLRAKERSGKRADQSKPIIEHGKWHN
ncbi:hypothetical protein niasHS_001930 [Heterodera schachtii]|uniref:Uncharacterized protein n=2 Tax=Heterodera TaxID=34509 RepID=A0ABD2KAQ3_HETSC